MFDELEPGADGRKATHQEDLNPTCFSSSLSFGLDNQPRERLRPPQYVKIGLHFETHAIFHQRECPRVGRRLRKEVLKIFSPNEGDILFLENSEGDAPEIQWFLTGYRHYGSLRTAFAFMSFIQGEKRYPSDTELQQYRTQIETRLAFLKRQPGPIPSPFWDFLYFWEIYGVFDQLIAARYRIDLVYERGRAKESLAEQLRRQIAGVEDYRTYMIAQDHEAKQRNPTIVSQLAELVAEAERSRKKTNIFLILGKSHRLLVAALPENWASVTTVHVPSITNYPPPIRQLHDLLADNQPVSEKLWQEAFEAERRLLDEPGSAEE